MTEESPKTLTSLSADYCDHLRSHNYSPRTVKSAHWDVRKLLRWLSVTYQIHTPDRLGKRHIRAWQRHLLDYRTAKGLPLRPGTVNSRLAYTKGFLLFAAERGYVLRSLAQAVEPVKTPVHLPGGVLTHEQIRRILKKIPTSTPEGYRSRAILELLYTSGIRAGELVGLDVADINFESGTALVLGKGNRERVVPIGRTALRYLKSYVAGVRPFLAKDGTEPALFLNRNGQRYSYPSLWEWIRETFDRLEPDAHVTAHTFRRSCTTELIKQGANIYHVKELLGHATLNTLKHYTRLTITDLKRTHEKCHPRERDNG